MVLLLTCGLWRTETMAKMVEKIVRTTGGFLRGQKLETISGFPYYSFQGIPYAKPPVGPLRFKPPQPPESWLGVRDALKEGSCCPAYHMITQQYLTDSNEDCLFLNVYTPKVGYPEGKSDKLRAVLFWIHGGGFNTGSGDTDMYGPDHLVARDVVLVTINYRLGVLGFLSLQNAECPGNNGLKDMVAALQWVKKNIAGFGGDPGNVTIFGESAGGAAVQYLLLSNLAKGLFHKAISQSGSVLNPWAMSRRPKEYAVKLAERLGCTSKNEGEILEFLRTLPYEKIARNGFKGLEEVEPEERYIKIPFVPVIEPPGDGAFLTENPVKLLEEGRVLDVPYIIGANSLEGLILLKAGAAPQAVAGYLDMKTLVPVDLPVVYDSLLHKQITDKIKEFYFKDKFEVKKFVNALSAIYFANGVSRTVHYYRKMGQRKSLCFAYEFTFNNNIASFKKLLGFDENEWDGACHADELVYLFQQSLFGVTLEPGTPDAAMMEKLTTMWTDFAKTGRPSQAWEPISSTNSTYMDISNSPVLKQNLSEPDATFWRQVYESASSAQSKL